MHPILSNRTRQWLYQSAWIAVGAGMAGILVVVVGRPLPAAIAEAVPMTVLYAFMCLSAWWVCRAAPLGRTPASRVVTMLLGSAVFSSLLWAVLAGVWAAAVDRLLAGLPAAGAAVTLLPVDGRHMRSETFGVYAIAGVPLFLGSAAVHYLIDAFESSRAAERAALEAQVVARDAELRALRAQLNPHFLFNSLNSINALIGTDPEGARRMCERLGDFLRRTLALAACESVPLEQEMALIEHYLGIERVRFGSRLKSAIDIDDAVLACAVPPLVLQPLVENALKHGVSDRVEGGEIRIVARRENDMLRVTVMNPYDEDIPARPGAGVGLDNVRRRLHTVAPRHARLSTSRAAGVFRAELVLPATAAPAAGAPAAGTTRRP
jgi:two-component sensor histidine kinase